jgi:hypothetical protein
MKRQVITQHALIIAAFVVLFMMTWATGSRDPYVFVGIGLGLLVCIGITICRTRAGHFKD